MGHPREEARFRHVREGDVRAPIRPVRRSTSVSGLPTRCGNVVGSSPAIQRVLSVVEKVADANSTVLVTGESGTGKELVARALHDNSRRADCRFVTVNCAAIPEELLESELFGHVRGAFTHAVSNREGRFAMADGGTIFLDEIGELPPDLQVKLLRVLETGEFNRVGASRPLSVDVRVIAATNRHLEAEVAEGRLREDFFYRVHVYPVTVPPLRERPEDIPAPDPLAIDVALLDMNHGWPNLGHDSLVHAVMDASCEAIEAGLPA